MHKPELKHFLLLCTLFIFQVVSQKAVSSNADVISIGTIIGGDIDKVEIFGIDNQKQVSLETPVHYGDIIALKSNEVANVVILLCGEEVKQFIDSSGYVVDQCSNKLNLESKQWITVNISDTLKNLGLNLREFLKGNAGETDAKIRGDLIDNDRISSSILPSSGALISPGVRSLNLIWQGGTPPFKINLFDNNGNLVASSQDMKNKFWSTPPLDLIIGEYKLSILDAESNEVTRKINVKKLPVFPPWKKKIHSLHKADQDLIISMWLYDLYSDGRWSLEAYNKLYGRSDISAKVVLDAIENNLDLNMPW